MATALPSTPRSPTSAWTLRTSAARKPSMDALATTGTAADAPEVPPPLTDQSSWPDVFVTANRGRGTVQSPLAAASKSMSPTRRAQSRSKKQKWVQIAPSELQAAADAALAAARQQRTSPRKASSHHRSSSASSSRSGHNAHRPSQAPPIPPVPPLPPAPSSIDDVFVVKNSTHIHLSTTSVSSTASASHSTGSSGSATQSTRATSPSSSLASLPSTAAVNQKTSPVAVLSQLPIAAPRPPRQDDQILAPDRAPVEFASGVSVPAPRTAGHVVFGSIDGSVPSDDEPAPKPATLALTSAASSIGSSPALSAHAGPSLSFFADADTETDVSIGQPALVVSPQTPLEAAAAWELSPNVPPWTPHSHSHSAVSEHATPPLSAHQQLFSEAQYAEYQQSWPRSPSSSYYYTPQHYVYAHAQSWEPAEVEPQRPPRNHARRKGRDDIFEVDYSRRPRAYDNPAELLPQEAYASRRDRERNHESRYASSRSREAGEVLSSAPRGRRNSFAGRGRGGGARSHSQGFDGLTSPTATTTTTSGRGRGRGGYRGTREVVVRDFAATERQPPSPDGSMSYWDSSSTAATAGTTVSVGEGLPIPIPRTVLRTAAGDGAAYVTPTQYFVLGQLEWYFSARNLTKDVFLRQQMDSKGWVPLALVASFHRLRALIDGSMPLLRDAAALSEMLEAREERIRLRDGAWERWVLRDASPSVVEGEETGWSSVEHGLPFDLELIEKRREASLAARQEKEAAEKANGVAVHESDDEEEEDSDDDDIVFVMSAGD